MADDLDGAQVPASNVTMTIENEFESSMDRVWHEHWSKFPPVSREAHVIMGALVIVVLFMSIAGNSTVMWVVVRFRTLRTPANILILNLAFSDLLMAASGYPLMVYSSFKGRWTFGKLGCDIYGFTGTVFGLMSINTLVFISLDRYFAIVKPEKSQQLTYRQVSTWLLAIWGYSVFWGILPFLGWSRFVPEGFGTTCSIDYLTSGDRDKFLLISMFVADFIFPLTLIIYFYIMIYLTVRGHRQKYGHMLSPEKQVEESTSRFSTSSIRSKGSKKMERPRFDWTKTEMKIARTILLVVTLFCLSWTPYGVITLIGQYGNRKLITPAVSMVPVFFAKLSTTYNPLIYFILHPKFQSKIREVFPWNYCFQTKVQKMSSASQMKRGNAGGDNLSMKMQAGFSGSQESPMSSTRTFTFPTTGGSGEITPSQIHNEEEHTINPKDIKDECEYIPLTETFSGQEDI